MDLSKAPLLERQAVYFSTGAVGGLAALLTSAAAGRLSSTFFPIATVNKSAVRHALAGAGTRFLAFDLFRDASQDKIQNPILRSAMSGCVGGLAETLQTSFAQAVAARSAAPLRPGTLLPSLASHGGTLFLCFGGFVFLSTAFSIEQPPSPITTFLLGGLSGSFGVPAIAAMRSRSMAGWMRNSAGAFIKVGTVIGLQVQSSFHIIRFLEERRLHIHIERSATYDSFATHSRAGPLVKADTSG